VVLIVSVEVADVAPCAMEAPGDEQVAPEGSPAAQDSVTAPLKLFFGVRTIWKTAGFPAETVALLELAAIVKLGCETTWLKTVEVLAAKLASPAYVAVMGCVPAESVEVVKAATALAFRAPVPTLVALSRKVTVPVGVPEVLDMMVAVNVTGAPVDDAAAELTSVAVVGASVTVSVMAAEMLLAKFALPPYLQVIE
jgi:hypothetical protein